MRHVALFLPLALLALPASAQVVSRTPGSAAAEPRSGTARVTAHRTVIDGRLDDPAWGDAQVFAGFVQREPLVGAPASERTEVRVFTDAEALYVGAWLYDRSAGEIVPGEKVRDAPLNSSDYFALILDTFHDRQNGFVFGTTPSGIEYDGQVTREGEGGGVFQQGQSRAQTGAMGGFNLNWDGSWTVATTVDSLGWYAEFRIPFTTLRYGAGQAQTWGLNLARLIRRKNEEVFWAPIPRQFGLHRLSLAGTLTDVRVPARRIATVTPYTIGATRQSFGAAAGWTTEGDVGVDAKLGVTPSLTLDLTYNTDFAQVEVDDQRVNLTRFPVFFPEKRPFFLENAGTFSAGTPQAVDLFFSRRIGIDTAGNTLPIAGGGRLSGKIGATTVGLLHMLTNRTATQAGQSYSVGRMLREVGRRSRLGVIAVQRQARDGPASRNLTYGVDGRLGVGDAGTIDIWGARTETPGRGRDDFAWSTRAGYQTDRWNNNLRLMQVGSDFNPELGFLNRTGGYRYLELMVMRLVRDLPWEKARVWNPHVSFRSYNALDGYWQSGWVHLDLTEIELQTGTRFGPEVNLFHEGLRAPFEIAEGVTLPVGSYEYPVFSFDFTTDPSAWFSFTGRADHGPFYNGSRSGTSVTFTARRGAAFSSSLLLDYSDVHLAQGDFVRSLLGVRLAYFFTPRVSFQSLTQFNNQQRIWSMNARLSWLSTAGTGLFVVFNDGEEADGFLQWRRPLTRSFTLKYSRQIGSGG